MVQSPMQPALPDNLDDWLQKKHTQEINN